MQSRKRLLLLIALVALAIIIAVILWQQKKDKAPAQTNENIGNIQVKAIEPGDVPGGLPENLPIEPGSEVLQNYQATANGDRIQGTRKFTTKKPLASAIKTYTDFFKASAWVVVDEQNGDGYQTVLLRRNDSTVLVVVREDAAAKKNVVEITLSETRKQK